ncbi:MAG: guanylate kinase [Candidatus Krumholzibacteria bacterium]|nr:guanylate kinase [Candidatus Krumholzibacteria bacterium]
MTSRFGVSRMPFIVVFSGPSGVGKSTVVDRVLKHVSNFVSSVSVTTRSARGAERDGVDYFFVTRGEFERRRDGGEFLEWAEVHGNLYGTPAAFLAASLARGANVLLEIDVQGGMSVRERYPDAVLVFLVPPDLETLKARLRGRATDDDEVIRRRLENAKREIEYFKRYDYVVVNDDVERCADDCLAIIRAEALREHRTAAG